MSESEYDTTVTFESLPYDKLVEYVQIFEALLNEMRVFDIEDAEDAASGRFPLPPQPYCESPRFKELTRLVLHIKDVQRQRTEEDTDDEDVDDDIFENLVTQPQSLPCSHHNTTNDTTTSLPPVMSLLILCARLYPFSHISAFCLH